MPSLEARENAFHFEEADLADNIDENVEEVELEISQINSDEFDFTEVTQKSYTETTAKDRLLENRGPIPFKPEEMAKNR